jgi:hypothetical protein
MKNRRFGPHGNGKRQQPQAVAHPMPVQKPARQDGQQTVAELQAQGKKLRKLSSEETLIAQLMQARAVLAARGKTIAEQQAEIAKLKGEVMALSIQIEDAASEKLCAQHGLPSSLNLLNEGGELWLVEEGEAAAADGDEADEDGDDHGGNVTPIPTAPSGAPAVEPSKA